MTPKINLREVRALAVTDLRSVSEDGKTYLEGYAARYNTPTTIGFGVFSFREVLAPGAFTRALSEGQDVRHLINHDPNFVLGRTTAQTTVLSEDERGLKFRTLLPDTQFARDLSVSVVRGDINECSFGFMVPKGGDSWSEDEDGTDIRTLKDVDLMDVSTVTYPAYPGTNTQISRMMFPDGVPAEIRARQQRDMQDSDGDNDNDMEGCACPCDACVSGHCEQCSEEMCSEEMCLHDYPAAYNSQQPGEQRAEAKTKRVDGEDLTASAFLIVGDENDTSTWHLPVHFSTEEKTINHIKNALSRFDQVKGVSDAQKATAWHRLEKLAEDHGIKVSDEDKAKHRTDDPAAEAAAKIAHAKAKLRAIEAEL